jgi:hypothetical protein
MVDTSTVLVAAASGGLGASTLALAVGRRLAATGPPAVVVDLDLERGGLEVTAGVEHLPGRRWDELHDVRGRVPPDLLLASLPVDEGCHVLSMRGGASSRPPNGAVLDVLGALRVSGARVVLDVPVASPAMPTLLSAATLLVVLVSLSTRGLADADAAVHRLIDASDARRPDLDVRLVTRGKRAGSEVVDDVVAHLGVPHLHHLPDERAVARDAERGVFPGTRRDVLRRCADVVAAAVADGLAVAS